MIIGFATGCLYKTEIYPISNEAVNLMKESKINAIEFTAHDLDRLKKLKELDRKQLSSFQYISLHVPTFNIQYGLNAKSKLVIKTINDIQKKIRFNLVVFHPDTIIDLRIFSFCRFPLGIENMDNRKKTGRLPEDLKKFITKNNFKFVLDLQHIYDNDPTMGLADDFLKLYAKKLVQIHLSGSTPVCLHHPLYLTKQKIIIKKAKSYNLPIIIESVFNPKDNLFNQIRKEFRYIKSFLNAD
ncbi:MAG: hypothetical protein A2729_02675 [Candidatus Buchananbacteria bacterium RIFCSPHIGHO2_01_FULL_39_14]|uniref:Xylose isomerase-like TIM barrel domain-containing protein n=1 Tax=Candidatus Buchananbacteria bacterium RIFCSPHIGHO2_01_FULL_39_14 TaxID=1797532 RepID=A0A1G1XUH0_9BACT|nr:MAG: hypothetical protein A2729_02675 [Candidatus Buchananbacteria bacterium RIFCSPHIGHO2_01_FULL_39_14]OGY48910.1 MAG: hypothetical protein A3D39_01325 [Candidatus Buchananbacteria bacterium RIFCSPHIGHO2_02_FULL_39_17]